MSQTFVPPRPEREPLSPPIPILGKEPIAGKYRVERVIGAGGMGMVVAATHLQLNQLVALKLMQPAMLGNSEAVGRFIREARAAVRLKSEHVGRVLDLGSLENGAPYIVMEYLRGEDLEQHVTARGPLPVAEATGYVLQALDAIAEAHAAGIVHRDLKPANLFLTQRTDGSPCVKVLDFGISKFVDPGMDGVLHATDARTLLGTPHYMAYEQLVPSGPVDARVDVWAVGCILYRLISGRVPFEGGSLAELILNVQQPPRPLHELRSGVPKAFSAVVARCLEKDPSKRFSHVAALAEALEPFGPESERGSAGRIAAVLGLADSGTPKPGDIDLDFTPSRGLGWVWVSAAIVGTGLLLWLSLTSTDAHKAPAQPSAQTSASSAPIELPEPRPANVARPLESPAVAPAPLAPVAAKPASTAPQPHGEPSQSKPKVHRVLRPAADRRGHRASPPAAAPDIFDVRE